MLINSPLVRVLSDIIQTFTRAASNGPTSLLFTGIIILVFIRGLYEVSKTWLSTLIHIHQSYCGIIPELWFSYLVRLPYQH